MLITTSASSTITYYIYTFMDTDLLGIYIYHYQRFHTCFIFGTVQMFVASLQVVHEVKGLKSSGQACLITLKSHTLVSIH